MSVFSDVQELYNAGHSGWEKTRPHILAHALVGIATIGFLHVSLPEIGPVHIAASDITGNDWFKLAKDTGIIYVALLLPLVLFSAAVPGQGGSHHINEQWPSYWRSLFAAEGFKLFDPIRPLIRHNSSVQWWYRQNLLVFASPGSIGAFPQLGEEVARGGEMEWIHISLVRRSRDLRSTLRNMPGVPWTWSHLKPWVRPIIRRLQEPAN